MKDTFMQVSTQKEKIDNLRTAPQELLELPYIAFLDKTENQPCGLWRL